MANMVQAEIMHEHAIPIICAELLGEMSCHIIVYFSKVLMYI